MTKCSALSVREVFARTILQLDRFQTPTEAISLAWTLRNRAEDLDAIWGRSGIELSIDEARDLCHTLLADLNLSAGEKACHAHTNGNGSAATVAHADNAAFQRALVCVSMVWDGVVPDPTNGATRVHLHDRQPAWADDCEATALIGPLLFLRSAPVSVEG